MKKRIPFFLCALLLLTPLSAAAESLPEVLGAVSQGLSEGLKMGAKTLAAPDADLTLTLEAGDTRLEEGGTLTLTLTAGNPYPQAVDVSFSLALPERLSCAQETAWQMTLESAKTDPATGELTASATKITRDITLIPGSGESEQVTLLCEMNMGTRFYRAAVPLDLCVPSISTAAILDGGEDGLDIYRRIAEQAQTHIRAGGSLLMEVGEGEAADVAKLFPQKSMIAKDFNGVDRYVKITF